MIRLERRSSDGIWNVRLAGPRLRFPPREPGRWETLYGYGSFLQISPDHVALLVNRRVLGEPVIDFEDGADLFVLESLDALASAVPFPVVRSERFRDSRTGIPAVTRCIARIGGFVPLGARVSDGRIHPAAGTGFILASHHPIAAEPHPHPDDSLAGQSYGEMIHLRWDGHTLIITDRFHFQGPELHPDFWVIFQGLSTAIPDGEDLLTGIYAGPVAPGIKPGSPAIPCSHPHAHRVLGRNVGSCFCRWRYGPQGWRPIQIVPVSGPDLAMEPSLIRLAEGALLMSVRGKGLQEPPGSITEGLENTYEHFRVYRSDDNGITWRPLIHLPRMRNATPVVINRTVGGTAFLTANPYQALQDSRGRVVPSTMIRNLLALWPLDATRGMIGKPLLLLDADRTFGPPRTKGPWDVHLKTDNRWNLDHPIATPIRLADGRWRAVMTFRVTDAAVNQGGASPAEPAGFWTAEIEKTGENDLPIWNFV